MNGFRFAAVLFSTVCAACVTPPTYRLDPAAGLLSRSTAEQAMADRVKAATARYVPERLDAPLEMTEVHLPDYPASALRAGAQGDVVVAFTVDVDGSVKDVEIHQSSSLHLQRPSLDAVRQWRFKPPMKDGKPKAIRVLQPLTFTLN